MQTRALRSSDYGPITAVVDDWWGGRAMARLLQPLFFDHFQDTSFVIEDDGRLVAFLIGFLSQSRRGEAYIHFVGVRPAYRRGGIARTLYELFSAAVQDRGCTDVRCITAAINERSIAFHRALGFSASLKKDYSAPGADYVLFHKTLARDGHAR